MPLIQITMREGRPAQDLRALISAVTDAACSTTGAPKETVRVIVTEVPATHWAAGDVTLAERTQAHD